jgi:hypothetical protein
MSQYQRGQQHLGHKRPDQAPEAKLQGSHAATLPPSRQFAQGSQGFSACPQAFGVAPLPTLAELLKVITQMRDDLVGTGAYEGRT